MEKQPIIFIHGAGGGGWEWKFWEEYFANEDFQCFSPTLDGEKEVVAERSFADYIHQLQKIIRLLKQKPILIGASMGGILAQKLAESENIKAMVLINSVPPKNIGDALWFSKKPKYPPVIPWSTQSTLQDTIDCMPEATKKTIDFAHPKWRDESGLVLNIIKSGIVIDKSKITCPVLVISGKNDTDISPKISKQIAKVYSADYVDFEGVSHVGALLGKHYKKLVYAAYSWIQKNLD